MNKSQKALETIWRIPDELWNKLKPILDEYDPPKRTGRKRIDARAALDAIIFRLRSGCQWNQLPAEFPDDRSIIVLSKALTSLPCITQIYQASLYPSIIASTTNRREKAKTIIYEK